MSLLTCGSVLSPPRFNLAIQLLRLEKNNILYDGNDLSAFVLIHLLSLCITLCTVT